MSRNPKKETLLADENSGGEELEQNSLLHRARRVASVGLLGAALGAIIPIALPVAGLALTAEGVGLVLGLGAGVLLTAKHLV